MDAAKIRIDADAYVHRIGYAGTGEPTAATLHALHRQHMLSVPFENLDIPLGRRITLDPTAIWQKVVERRRGGFCYELNTLFGLLLQALGYRIDFLGARVWSGTAWGPEKDHMALWVDVDGASWLADVGFGDSFLRPLRLEPALVQNVPPTSFRLLNDGPAWTMQALAAGAWESQYQFTLTSHAPESFAAMCDYQQTSPETTFTQRVVCSRATPRGRVSVTHDRLIVTAGGVREESALADAAAFQKALAAHHGIELGIEDCEAIVRRFSR